MKKAKILINSVLCAILIFSLIGCSAEPVIESKPVNGATVFRALKNNVSFDSTLSEVPNAEHMFENLPEGSDVTLMTGPSGSSDQLGMVEVQNSSDLDDAEASVNNYLQDKYDSVCVDDPGSAKKFENVAVWKYDVYIVFCITIDYTHATQIINNTVSGNTAQTPNITAPTEHNPTFPKPTEPEDDVERWLLYIDNEPITIELQDSSFICTYYEYEDSDPQEYCETYSFVKEEDANYTYYFLSDNDTILIEINDEMLAVAHMARNDEQAINITTPSGVNVESYIDVWGFKEGSDDPIPSNADLAKVWATTEEDFNYYADEYPVVYRYYAQSKMLLITNELYGECFYVSDNGSVTYLDGISLTYLPDTPDPNRPAYYGYYNVYRPNVNYVIIDIDGDEFTP